MKIKYWKNFSKRRNSTKQPAAISATEIDVDLLEPCSTETPDFILDIVDTAINYVQAFGHYYYVTDRIILDGPRMQIACAIDEIASAKSDILAGKAFVKRSSSLFKTALRDDMVSVVANATKTFKGSSTIPFSTTGCYILNVVSNTADNGATCAYIISQSNLALFTDWLNHDIENEPWYANFLTWATVNIGNIFNAIMGCKWIPIDYDTIKTDLNVAETYIHVAQWDSVAYGIKLPDKIYKHVSSIDISDVFRPTDFRKCSPYSSYEIFLPFYGMLSLDATKLDSTFTVEIHLDPRTGDMMYIGFASECVLFTVTASCASDIPIAKTELLSSNTMNVVSGVGGVLTESGGITSIASALTGARSIISSIISPSANVRGSIGGKAMADEVNIYVVAVNLETTEPVDLEATYGRPLEECVALSGLSGYVQTYHASISTHLTPNETAAVNAALDSGIYLE